MSKKALIVYGGWSGHSPKETSELLAGVLRSSDFEVELSDTLDSLANAERLKTFDLIVPNWTMGDLPGEKEKALVDAVLGGVGLAGFHGGMGDAFRSSTGYQFMVGGQFVAHPDNAKDYVVNLVKTSDPIVAGMKDFIVHSEQYYMHVDPAIEVLAATTFQTKETPWVDGTVVPVVWKKNFGQGRVFYQSVGHSPADFDIPEVREITRRGCVWAAR